MAVFSGWCGRKADDVVGFDLFHDLFKSECRDMMALVNDDLAVLGDEVLDFAGQSSPAARRNRLPLSPHSPHSRPDERFVRNLGSNGTAPTARVANPAILDRLQPHSTTVK